MPSSRSVPPERLILAAALLLAFGIFVPTLRFGFVHDDVPQIIQNPTLRSWSYLPGFFTHHLWAQGQASTGNYYRPIFQSWLLLNYQLFGGSAWGWHLLAVLLHMGVTWLVYHFAVRLVDDKTMSAVAALLFAVHTIHIESVSWVSGAVDPLMALFLLASVLALLEGVRRTRKVWWVVLSLALFGLALLTKETAVVFPLAVWLFSRFFSRFDVRPEGLQDKNHERRATGMLWAAPFFAVVLMYLIVRWRVLGGFEHPLTAVPGETLVLTAPWALAFYLQHLVWPVGLSLFYDQHYVTQLSSLEFLIPLLIVMAVIAQAVWLRRRAPVVSFLICWFFLFLLPCLNLRAYQAGEVAHDRYLYVPSIAFCLLLAMLLQGVAGKRKVLYAGACLCLVMAYALGAISQEAYYRDNYVLAVRGVTIAPNNTAALLLFARELTSRDRVDDALAAYARLTAEVPSWWTAWYERGEAALRFQKWQEADTALMRAIGVDPHEPSQYYLRAIAESRSGDLAAARLSLEQGIINAADLPMFRQGLQQLQEHGSLGP